VAHEPFVEKTRLLSTQDEFARIDKALAAKLPGHLTCPLCGHGVLEPIRAEFILRARTTQGIEPIETIAQTCISCGFMTFHATTRLLDTD
jgi:ribosomal protein S27AE